MSANKINTENLWNRLVKLRDATKNDATKNHADMLLKQMNTAAGQIMLKNEVAEFLHRNQ